MLSTAAGVICVEIVIYAVKQGGERPSFVFLLLFFIISMTVLVSSSLYMIKLLMMLLFHVKLRNI